MVKINEFMNGNVKFVIEPSVEVGDHTVDSLGKLAAIAAVGYSADAQIIENITGETDRTLGQLDPNNFGQYLTNVASRGIKKHTVYTSKY